MRSQILFENQHYVVCVTRPGLTVQSKTKNSGKLIRANNPSFSEWVECFKTAIDGYESHALAKAIYQAEG